MTDLVQLVSIVVSAVLLASIVELVRRGRLTEEYSLIWIVCAVALLALSLWRNLLDVAASALGVHYPPDVIAGLRAGGAWAFFVAAGFSLFYRKQK